MNSYKRRKDYKMEKDLIKFMEKVEIINKDLSRYVDKEKGIIFSIGTVQLFPTLDYLELDEKQYETALFEGKIDKLDYNTIVIQRPALKYERTKKEEDKNLLENKSVEVKQIWNIINPVGAHKSFATLEEAIMVYDEIYDGIIKQF